MTPQRRTVTVSPENSETPLELARTWVTPTPLFFVRNHFAVPTVDAASWLVSLQGWVNEAKSWSVAELAAMPQHAVFATVECAGNGRSFLPHTYAGVPWGAGAIGHAQWSRVRLRDLLVTAGLQPAALEVVFEGADRGREPDEPAPITFSRSLPLAKALHPDTLIALRMNGELLEPNHGAPVRLFVPGWYGVASVKWLRSIRVIDHVYPGHFQTVKYAVDRGSGPMRRRLPLGPGIVKSEIVHPAAGAVLGLGTHRIAGIAWAGEEQIARVDVSSDDGNTWQSAHLRAAPQPYCWCEWEAHWTVAVPGNYRLMARAHTTAGQSQPFHYNPDNLGYLINLVLPRVVHVTADAPAPPPTSPLSWADTLQQHAADNIGRRLDVDISLSAGGGI